MELQQILADSFSVEEVSALAAVHPNPSFLSDQQNRDRDHQVIARIA
jgi:hypothetical protein